MRKTVISIVGIIAIIMSLYAIIPDGKNNDMLLANVEALSDDADETIHIWCCGKKDTCAKGEKVKIKGKISNEPCK